MHESVPLQSANGTTYLGTHEPPRPRKCAGGALASFHQYCEETGIFAIGLQSRKYPKVETVFWLLCSILLIALTIKEVVHITTTFLNQDTLSLTSKITNKTIALDPPPVFMFSHNVSAAEFRHLPNESRLTEMVDKFLDDMNAFLHQPGLRALPRMEPELLDLTAAMLLSLRQGEIDLLYRPVGTSWQWLRKFHDRPNFGELQSLAQNLSQTYAARRVDFGMLMKIISSMICMRFKFVVIVERTIFDKRIYDRSTPCRPENMFLFTSSLIGFRITKNAISFNEFNDKTAISWDAGFSNSDQTSRTFIDVSGTARTSQDQQELDTQQEILFHRGDRVIAPIRITAAYLLDKEKTVAPCSQSVSRYDCKELCKILRLDQICGCYPLHYAMSYPPAEGSVACPYQAPSDSNSLAGSGEYLTTANSSIRQNEKALKSCYAACLPNCLSKTFITSIDREVRPTSTQNELVLVMKAFTYPLIEEKLVITSATFLSQMGGILGIYIGLTFADLIFILVFVIRKTVGCCGQTENSRTPNEETAVGKERNLVGVEDGGCEHERCACQEQLARLKEHLARLEEQLQHLLDNQKRGLDAAGKFEV